MAEGPAPSQLDIWTARALLVAGLWFGGSGLFDMVRDERDHWSDLLVHAPGIAAGALFLTAAWRMRAALRWDPPPND